MRDDRLPPRVTGANAASDAPSIRSSPVRRTGLWLSAGCGVLLIVIVVGAWSGWSRQSITVERTPLERLAEAEQDAIALAPGQLSELPLLIGADRGVRRRVAMLRARLHLRVGAPLDAIELLDHEERAGAVDIDGAWLSLRVRALRQAGRSAEATTECDAWRLSLSEEHPDRAWADAERALDAVLNGDVEGAERAVTPWLDRSLSPLPSSRLRLVEAFIRSALGDHAVAAAAFDSAASLDRGLEPRATLGAGVLLDAATELAIDAATAGAVDAAITLHERALHFAGESIARTDLLERYAMLCRADAQSLLTQLQSGLDIDVERINRRFVNAAEAATEFATRLSTDRGGDSPERRSAALFAAAECWERSGRGDQAVTVWREWLLARPDSDPQRAEVLWRVAETQHGLGRFSDAADAWMLVLKAHPNSPQAARAPIASAQALRALERDDDAVALLDGVLEGRGGIDPESPAYVEALVARGRLAHARGEAAIARRRLDEALRREPLHPESLELTVLLADAWRLEATAAAARADGPGTPSERAAARRESNEAWHFAAQHFAECVARLDGHDPPLEGDRFAAERSAFARLGLAAALEALGRLDEAALAYEETDRRHSDLEASLVALDRRRALPGADVEAIRVRALRRIETLAEGGRMMSREAWRAWFDADREPATRLAGGVEG